MKKDEIAKALYATLISPNVADSNLEPANVVDSIDRVASALYAVADAIRKVEDAMNRYPAPN